MGKLKKTLSRLERPLFFLVLCLGVAIILKWGVVAGYTIPTTSMEPTLIGDPEHGDKVAVFKLQYKFSKPSRYDLVVFFKEGIFPDSPGLFERQGGLSFIKRVVAFPGETILIKDGDLFLGPQSREPDRKPLSLIENLLIPVYKAEWNDGFYEQWVGDSEGALSRVRLDPDGLLCPARSAEGEIRLQYLPERKIIYDDYRVDGSQWHQGTNPVRDVALSLDLEFLNGPGVVFASLLEGADTFTFMLRSEQGGGGGQVQWNFGQGREISASRFPGFKEGERYAISFMNIDDRILLEVDGEVLAEFNYPGNRAYNPDILVNTPKIGVRDADVRIRDLEIDRDIFYTCDQGNFAVRKPYTVPEGHYFFLGDNSSESEDSRTFGPISEDDLIGKPFMIFYPFDRIRFF